MVDNYSNCNYKTVLYFPNYNMQEAVVPFRNSNLPTRTRPRLVDRNTIRFEIVVISRRGPLCNNKSPLYAEHR